jgi:sugar lactone lactonase YvrE
LPVDNPSIDYTGHGLSRPECALAHVSGMLFVPDWTGAGGISAIFPDGTVKRHLAKNPPLVLRPNGIALAGNGAGNGDVLLVHLGAEDGGVWRLRPDGSVDLEIGEVDNVALPPSNFCHVDGQGRRWLSVSTRHVPRAAAYRNDIRDGFIVLSDERGTRIAADDLGYANECLVHPDGERLFVNETFGRRLTCFDISARGDLRNRRTITEFGAGTFPDGMAFDANGDVWIVSILSNRVIRIDAQGSQTLFMEDADAEFLQRAEQAFQAGQMGRPHLDNNPARNLRNISSMAFSGPDLDRIVFGCLLGDRLPIVRSPVSGWPMPHYHDDITPLLAALDRTLAVSPATVGENQKEN